MGEPGIIKKLDEDVVNRIAAGEIVQRPANALKELIENSLDAKATSIVITVKAGGLKYLQIQDNGTGIRSDNLDIVCERFTTSKLSQYEDLQEIATYGFRGEALASISHIAHMAIMTKTATDKCANKAAYENGRLKGPIKPCAGNNGTQITVEDLFYNVIARKKALRSPAEEYGHIMEVVGSYAIHNHQVGFTLKKFGETTDIKTPIKSSVVENVRIIYGNAIARELMEVHIEDHSLKMKINGFITNVNYSHKKGSMLLFINHRLVDSLSIRKAVDSIYSTYLPKNAHSFVYLSIELDPRNVDVNVHPTKHEVQFLYEEQILDKIKSGIEQKLLSCNSTRVMYTQARLPGATAVEEVIKKTTDGTKIYAHNLVRVSADTQKIDKFFPTLHKPSESDENYESVAKNYVKDARNDENVARNYEKVARNDETVARNNKKIARNNVFIARNDENLERNDENVARNCDENQVTRNHDTEMMDQDNDDENEDNQTRNILNKENERIPNNDARIPEITFNAAEDSMCIDESQNDRQPTEKLYTDKDITFIDPKDSFKTRKFQYERLETKLTSVKQLRMEVESKCNTNLREILANLIFIGCVDLHRSLIQHSTKLYLCDTRRMSEELFYETILYDFQNLGMISLSSPLPLEELFILGLSSQDEWNPELGDMRQMAEQMSKLLSSKRAMLLEYFSLDINSEGELVALPLLLDGHTPFMGALPTYLVRLVTEVNWDSEKDCFETLSRQTAIFYSHPNPDTQVENIKTEQWKIEHVIFPAIRRNFLPPSSFVSNGAILQIASLSDLYKVFERC